MSKPGPGFKDLFDEMKRRPYYWYADAELDFTEAVAECCPVMDDWKKFKRDLAKKSRVHSRSLDLLMSGGRRDLTLKQMTDIAFALGKKIKITLEDLD